MALSLCLYECLRVLSFRMHPIKIYFSFFFICLVVFLLSIFYTFSVQYPSSVVSFFLLLLILLLLNVFFAFNRKSLLLALAAQLEVYYLSVVRFFYYGMTMLECSFFRLSYDVRKSELNERRKINSSSIALFSVLFSQLFVVSYAFLYQFFSLLLRAVVLHIVYVLQSRSTKQSMFVWSAHAGQIRAIGRE